MLASVSGTAVAARVRAAPVKRDVRVMAATQRKAAAKSAGAGAGRTLWLPNTVRGGRRRGRAAAEGAAALAWGAPG